MTPLITEHASTTNANWIVSNSFFLCGITAWIFVFVLGRFAPNIQQQWMKKKEVHVQWNDVVALPCDFDKQNNKIKFQTGQKKRLK